MIIIQVIILALKGVWSNWVRSLLTVLGIIVGVGSVITLIAFSQGAKHEMLKQFDMWGATRMGVYFQFWMDGFPRNLRISPEDSAAIREKCWTIDSVATICQRYKTVSHGRIEQQDKEINGVELDFFKIIGLGFAEGGPITQEHIERRDFVCVLGATMKYELFFDKSAVGRYIHVGGKRCKVIGVLEEQGGRRWMSQDQAVLLPYTTLNDRFPGETNWGEISMKAIDVKYLDFAKLQVRELMYQRHPTIPLAEIPFNATEDEKEEYEPIQVWDMSEWRERREQTAESLAMFLIVMGSLALLIGGVGVMNVMLVSVEERTMEIGLRKALGASQIVVLSQFLLEAIIICAVGGGTGTLLAAVACKLIAKLPEDANMPDPILSSGIIALAFGVTFVIGLFSGFYPALKAAAVDPIESMRSE